MNTWVSLTLWSIYVMILHVVSNQWTVEHKGMKAAATVSPWNEGGLFGAECTSWLHFLYILIFLLKMRHDILLLSSEQKDMFIISLPFVTFTIKKITSPWLDDIHLRTMWISEIQCLLFPYFNETGLQTEIKIIGRLVSHLRCFTLPLWT